MAKEPDYRMKEVDESQGKRTWRVDFELPEDEMGIALIKNGVLGKIRNGEFYLDEGHPAACFRSAERPSHAMQVYPLILGIENLYLKTIAETHRLEKTLRAIALVNENKQKEGSGK